MQCSICGTTINNPKEKQTLCIVCHYEKKRIAAKKKREPKKKQFVRTCLTCGKEFQSEYKVEKYCSVTCRKHKSDHKVNSSWLQDENPLPKKTARSSFNKFQTKRQNEQRGE